MKRAENQPNDPRSSQEEVQEPEVRSFVIHLQTKELPASQQLAQLMALQVRVGRRMSPPATEYLNRQISALNEFIS